MRHKKVVRLAQKALQDPLRSVDVSLTPLIDTALTMLLIFMMVTPAMHREIAVALPSGKGGTSASDKSLTVTVDAQERIFVESERVSIDELQQRIATHMQREGHAVMLLKADASLAYRDVMRFITLAKEAGIERVGLALGAAR